MKKSMSIVLAVSSVMLGVVATGCGSNSFLRSVSVSVAEHNDGLYINLDSKFDLGQSTITDMDLDIIDPLNSLKMGDLSLRSTDVLGINELKLHVNTAVIPHADAELGRYLPNGRELPNSLGALPNEVLGIRLLDHSIIYVGGDTNTRAFVGVALAIAGLDQATGAVGVPSNLFMGIQVNPYALGIGGLYASPTPGQNGIAIFGRYTAQPAGLKVGSKSVTPQLDPVNLETQGKVIRFFNSKPKALKIQ